METMIVTLCVIFALCMIAICAVVFGTIFITLRDERMSTIVDNDRWEDDDVQDK